MKDPQAWNPLLHLPSRGRKQGDRPAGRDSMKRAQSVEVLSILSERVLWRMPGSRSTHSSLKIRPSESPPTLPREA